MTDQPIDPDEFVPLANLPSPMLAEMVVSHLVAAGIPAIAPGSQLKDEFAAFGQMSGLVGCEVRVPAERLEEAREVLELARKAGDDLSEAFDQEDESPS